MKLPRWLPIILIEAILVFLFVYFRLTPIINQTFPYTYDQGRDFLKAEQIVRFHTPTLIGPTTGIMGIFHGAWWYYFLSVPYFLFNGSPIGFVFFIFSLTLVYTCLFYLFLRKEFNFLTGIIFFILITSSSYFISMSSFAINGTLGFPFILLFFYSLYYFLKTKKLIYEFLIFLSLGFIFEAEVPLGLFTIPAFLLSIIVLKRVKVFISKKKNIVYSLIGFFIPFLPRLLFAVRHNFIQEKVAINFFLHPRFFNQKSFIEIIIDRASLFRFYYLNLFPINNQIVSVVILLIALIGLIIGYRKLSRLHKTFFNFIFLIVLFLFLLSCLYKDNFWLNYYEGLSFYFAVLITISLTTYSKLKDKFLRILPILAFILILGLSLFKFYQNITNRKPVADDGLRGHLKIVNYLAKINNNRDLCVRVYTPPVIPHTYNYLFSYYTKIGKMKKVTSDYINNQCWYIIENDLWQFRIDKYRQENIPNHAKLLKTNHITNNATIELWEYKPEK